MIMINYEKELYDIRERKPVPDQRVIVYIAERDEYAYAVFRDGKFYCNGEQICNVTKWIENDFITTLCSVWVL
jgi:hypothetical protein